MSLLDFCYNCNLFILGRIIVLQLIKITQMNAKMLLIALSTIIFSCANENIEADTIGFIEGKITIGPLCPVVSANTIGNPCGLTDAQMNQIYGAYKVVTTSSNLTTRKELTLDKTGIFKFEIPDGDYEIAVQKVDGSMIGISGEKSKVISPVKVLKNQTTKLEINIDTGIR